MTTTKFNVAIPQADTFRLVVNVVGGPADLTGYLCEMQVRPTKASTEVYADITADMFTVDPFNRQILLTVPDEETELYDWSGLAVYDLHMEGPGGDRWRVIEGTATLNKTVTRED